MTTRLAQNMAPHSPLLRHALEIHWAWLCGLAPGSSLQLSSVSLSVPVQPPPKPFAVPKIFKMRRPREQEPRPSQVSVVTENS